MRYYRVKEQYDNMPRFYRKDNQDIKRNGILIKNELYTERERAKIANTDRFFDIVEISKKNIYFFFGARFEKEQML